MRAVWHGRNRSQTQILATSAMKAIDIDFELPKWDVPPPRLNQISPEAWLEWLEENRRELLRTGQMDDIRNDPLRRPVDVRFKC